MTRRTDRRAIAMAAHERVPRHVAISRPHHSPVPRRPCSARGEQARDRWPCAPGRRLLRSAHSWWRTQRPCGKTVAAAGARATSIEVAAEYDQLRKFLLVTQLKRSAALVGNRAWHSLNRVQSWHQQMHEQRSSLLTKESEDPGKMTYSIFDFVRRG